VQVNIKNLIDDAQCYQTVRELRWPDGVDCPSCESKHPRFGIFCNPFKLNNHRLKPEG
jgi:hypothetical protein